MVLNDGLVDIEKSNVIFSPTFVVNEFSGLFLNPSIFSIKLSWSAKIIIDDIWDFLFG